MESKNHQKFSRFLTSSEKAQILDFIDFLKLDFVPRNHHLRELIGRLNGMSYMFDLSKSEISSKIAEYQSGGAVIDLELPLVFHKLSERITQQVSINPQHAFLQIVNMQTGGIIGPHYDAAFNGFINFKCNVSVLAEDYLFAIDNELVCIEQGDLYCFEASLHKHWTPEPFTSRRVLLSFGYMIPYSELGRDIHDPRVRLSQRIEKYFQS